MGMKSGYISPIKSIQRGVADLTTVSSLDVTISTVDTSKAQLAWLGNRITDNTATGIQRMGYLELINSTTLRVTRTGTTSGPYVSWQVVEYR